MRTIDADRLKAVLEKNFGHTGGASVLEQLIDEQPTIEPSTNCSEIPNSSDTISRQAAIDALENSSKPYVWQGAEIVRNLPPVQPEPTYEQVEEYCKRRCLHIVTDDFCESTKPQKLGHWIQYDKRFPWRHHYKCSECGNYLDFTGVNGGRGEANYCPNCGAKMTISK